MPLAAPVTTAMRFSSAFVMSLHSQNNAHTALRAQAVAVEQAALGADAERAILRHQAIAAGAEEGVGDAVLGTIRHEGAAHFQLVLAALADADIADEMPRARMRKLRMRGALHQPLHPLGEAEAIVRHVK